MPPALPSDEAWLSSIDLADRYCVPIKTIASWASAGTGPPHTRIGRHRRFRLGAVCEWEQRQRIRAPAAANPVPIVTPSLPDDETWLTTAELATRLQVTAKTLAAWASAGTGPRYARIGRHRRYRLADIRAWEHHLSSHHTP